MVGIRQLKARLSEYLREVRNGETFLVTDRDEVVAELRPASAVRAVAPDDLERTLEALASTGEVMPARLPKGDWAWSPAGAGLPAGTVSKLLDELRSERTQ